MSDDLIKRSDAIKAVSKVDDYGDGIGFEVRSHCLVELELVPSADRPQGEWQYVYSGKWMFRRCSCCEWTQTYDDSKYIGYRYNFCPNCGADMRGEKDETD